MIGKIAMARTFTLACSLLILLGSATAQDNSGAARGGKSAAAKPGKAQKAPAAYTALQRDKTVTVTAVGENPTGGWKNVLKVLRIDISPPEFKFTQTRPSGPATQVITPFSVSTKSQVPKKIDQVVVIDTAGRHKVPVEQAK